MVAMNCQGAGPHKIDMTTGVGKQPTCVGCDNAVDGHCIHMQQQNASPLGTGQDTNINQISNRIFITIYRASGNSKVNSGEF